MLRILGAFVVLAGIGAAAFLTRDRWSAWLAERTAVATVAPEVSPPIADAKVLKLSESARRNLELVAKPAKPQAYWRTIQVPGAIVDRPGRSDRGVTSPAVGAVSEIHAFPGDTVRPGDRLFTLRLFSEFLQNTQSELYKATQETLLIKEQRSRLETLAKSGAIPEARLIELDSQLRRQTAVILAYTQDLLTRGIPPAQIKGIADGGFVSTIDVVAPPPLSEAAHATDVQMAALELVGDRVGGPAYEVQELKVDLGQQVQAGQLLSMLANHGSLFIEGHAFKQDASFLAQAAENGWPVEAEIAEDDRTSWPAFDQRLEIRHLANSIDTKSRTFDFFVPLTNQSRAYDKDGQTFVVWRFRPGQRVRLHVPVEELRDVLVLPTAAVVREGPEAFVFRQNGDLFTRIPVHVRHEDRRHVVLANDGSVLPGLYLAQNGAASLNRVLKAQAASGVRADVHVHADGTVHGAH